MPVNVKFNGQEQWIPGAAVREDVVSQGAVAIGGFLVPIIVGDAFEGHPYNASSLQYASEESLTAFKYVGTDSGVARYFGPGSDIAVAAKYYKRGGGPGAYFVCSAPLTRASIPVTSTGPVNQFTLYGAKFGAPSNFIKVQWASSIMSITPVRNFALLSVAAASTAKRIYLKGGCKYQKPHDWIVQGQTVNFGDGATAAFTGVVAAKGEEFSSTGQVLYYIDLTTAIGTALAITEWACVFEYDANAVIVSPTFAAGDGQGLIDWINTNAWYRGEKILGAHRHADFTGALPIAVSSATVLREISAWGSVTDGTSPAGGLTNHQSITDSLESTWWDEFRATYDKTPYAFLICSSDTSIHADWSAFATLAAANALAPVPGWQNVAIYTGAAYGDTSVTATNSTSAVWRAAQINSQYFRLFAGQVDRLAPYLSFAAYGFGLRIGRGEVHDLTNDPLGTEAEITQRWDEVNLGQLTALIRAGVITYQLSASAPVQYVISAGVTTSQASREVWNEATNATSVDMTRVLADFAQAYLRQLYSSEPFTGGDEVDIPLITSAANDSLAYLLSRGIASEVSLQTVSLADNGAGYNITPRIKYRVPNWFQNITIEVVQ